MAAITGPREPHLDNQIWLHVLSQSPLSDKCSRATGRADNLNSEALAQNWNLLFSFTFWWKNQLKSKPRFSSQVMLIISTLTLTQPLSRQDHFHCQNSVLSFPFLNRDVSPQRPGPSSVPPICPRVEEWERRLQLLTDEAFKSSGNGYGHREEWDYWYYFCKPYTLKIIEQLRPTLPYNLWQLFFLWFLFT